MRISRRQVLITGAACAVAALPLEAFAIEGDMTIGNAASPVHLIEYASMTCSHCAAFHAQVFPQLKAAYIDTGRIAFTLREYPTAPPQVAFAMFQLARCGDAAPDVYFQRVGELFLQQRAIIETGTGAGIRDALIAIGAGWGLSEADVLACVRDEAAVDRITASIQSGDSFGITGTPAMILNNQRLQGPTSVTYAGLSAALDQALDG